MFDQEVESPACPVDGLVLEDSDHSNPSALQKTVANDKKNTTSKVSLTFNGLEVQQRLEASHVVLNQREVLVLYGAAHLQGEDRYPCSSLHTSSTHPELT